MVVCSAFGCTNRTEKKIPGVTFHRLPKNAERRASWVRAMRRENWNPSATSALCSEHFLEKDMDRTSLTQVRIREGAVPSIFPKFPSYLKTVRCKDDRWEKIQINGKRKLKCKAVPKSFDHTQPERKRELLTPPTTIVTIKQKNTNQDKLKGRCSKVLEAIKYDGITLDVLDQLLLPHKTKYENILNVDEGWELIRSMKVTGSAAISVVGAYSLAVELKPSNISSKNNLYHHIKQRLEHLITAQPTVINMKQVANSTISHSLSLLQDEEVSVCEMKNRVIEEIEKLVKMDISLNKSIGLNGGMYILSNTEGLVTILTHSNTGSLVTSGYGTAFGVIRWLHQQEKLSHVYFTNTRPYNQGTRLTAYELAHDQIPSTMICDSVVSTLLSTKKITAVVVGAQKIAANGDIANDIGTYDIAINALYHGVPLYIATRFNTLDMSIENGSLITIEEIPRSEGPMINSPIIIAGGINYWNPTFDITPAELITGGIITERGIFPASSMKKLGELWTTPKLLR